MDTCLKYFCTHIEFRVTMFDCIREGVLHITESCLKSNFSYPVENPSYKDLLHLSLQRLRCSKIFWQRILNLKVILTVNVSTLYLSGTPGNDGYATENF